MRVRRFRIHRFTLPLRRPLIVGGRRMIHREGRIIELVADTGHSALGEISPLPGVSEEGPEEVNREISGLRSAVMADDLPEDIDLPTEGCERWLRPLKSSPAVRFGLETAVLGLIAAKKGVPLCRLISETPRAEVSINALLAGPSEAILSEIPGLRSKGYGTFKLKVGGRPLEEVVRLSVAVRERIGAAAVLRLDANRAWHVDQALEVSRSLSHIDIDYIEEPVRTQDMLNDLLSIPDLPIPVALDESLSKAEPDGMTFSPHIGALVLKPTLLGLERTLRLAECAAGHGVKAVISSSFESGFGIQVLSHLAASVNQSDVPAGLGTGGWFQRDLLIKPLPIQRGRLPVVGLPQRVEGLRGELLE